MVVALIHHRSLVNFFNYVLYINGHAKIQLIRNLSIHFDNEYFGLDILTILAPDSSLTYTK